MLRQAQHDRKNLNDIESHSFVLSFVEGLREIISVCYLEKIEPWNPNEFGYESKTCLIIGSKSSSVMRREPSFGKARMRTPIRAGSLESRSSLPTPRCRMTCCTSCPV